MTVSPDVFKSTDLFNARARSYVERLNPILNDESCPKTKRARGRLPKNKTPGALYSDLPPEIDYIKHPQFSIERIPLKLERMERATWDNDMIVVELLVNIRVCIHNMRSSLPVFI